MTQPSWANYGTHDRSDEPSLWDGIWAAYAPHLGATGSTVYDLSGRHNNGSGNNWTNDTGWTFKRGFQNLDFQEANATTRIIVPNRASLQGQAQASFSLWLFSVTTPAANTSVVYDGITSSTNNRFGVNWLSTGVLQFQVRDNASTFTIAPSAATHTGVYGRWVHWCGTYDSISDNMQLFRNGDSVGTNSTAKAAIVSGTPTEVSFGGRNFASTSVETSADHEIADLRLWNRVLDGCEVMALAQAPGVGYGRRVRQVRVLVPDAGTTGTGASTLGAATSTATGAQTFSGTAGPSLGAATSTASGTQRFVASGAATLAAATATASGTERFAGTGASTLAAATATASGTETFSGTAGPSLDAATSTASGTQGTGTIGTAAVTLGAATASASGGQTFSGTGTPSCGAATSTASGALKFAGPGSATLGAATASATGTQTYTGTAAVTLGTAYSTASGSVASGPITGTAAVTLGTTYATASGIVLALMAPIFGVTVEGWTLELQADAETLQLDADAQTLRVTGG